MKPKGGQSKTLKVVGKTDDETTNGDQWTRAGAGLSHGQWADRWDLSGDQSR